MKALALILVSSCGLLCQTANEPIPPQWLHDGHLAAPEFNFSIDSPSPDSHWSRQVLKNGATGFTVTDSTKESYVIFVLDGGDGSRMDDPVNQKHFLEGMQKSSPEGWSVGADSTFEQSNFPTSGSWKIKTSIQRQADGYILHCYAYIVTGRRTYTLLTYSAEPTEPPRFHSFVSSFFLLSPDANVLHTSDTTNATTGLLFILAIFGAVSDWKYKRRGGNGSTKTDKTLLASGVSLCVVLLVVLGIRGASAEAIGSLAAEFMIVIFALWQFHRWSFRRRNPLFVAIPIPVDQSPGSQIKQFCTKCGGALISDMAFCGTCGTRRG